MAKKLISIFDAREDQPEVIRSMRDLISLAGVMKDLASQSVFDTPTEVLRFLRIIEFIHKESYGVEDDPIDGTETLYYRYQRYYPEEAPSKKRINQIVNILTTNNWVSKQGNHLKMMSVGKRMMGALTRLANDSLAYYLEDEIGRSLFQARRDAEMIEVYDDQGISGGNLIKSLTQNVKDEVMLLEERELELLADRNALPQLEAINELMKELAQKLDERLQAFETVEDSFGLSRLIQEGVSALTEGTSLSVGMINKYWRFMDMQQTVLKTTVSPERVRVYITKMFHPPLESDIPNVHQLLSFMEQDQYEGEALDGMWLPVKYASPLSTESIHEGVQFLENYEPFIEEIEDATIPTFVEDTLDATSIEDMVKEASWLMTKASIDTEKIEAYLEQKKEAEMEETIIETGSTSWSDAIRQLLGVAALEANKKVQVQSKEHVEQYEKEWEWIVDDDRKSSIQKRT